MNKYYLLHRPVGIGCQPKGFVGFEDFGKRTFIPEIGCEAWSAIWYDRELTEEELRNYEMMKGE